jgi:hypothetical protein
VSAENLAAFKKLAIRLPIALLLAWGSVTLALIWTDLVPQEFYWRFSVTCAVVGGVSLIVTLIVREYITENDLRKEGYIE